MLYALWTSETYDRLPVITVSRVILSTIQMTSQAVAVIAFHLYRPDAAVCSSQILVSFLKGDFPWTHAHLSHACPVCK